MGSKDKRKTSFGAEEINTGSTKRSKSEHSLAQTEELKPPAEACTQLINALEHIFENEKSTVAAKEQFGGEVVEHLKNAAAAMGRASQPLRKSDRTVPPIFRSIDIGKPSTRPTLPKLEGPLRDLVFTHRSAADSKLVHKIGPEELSYEKLEWYGDAYLELIATRTVWNWYSYLDVKKLSQLREQVQTNEVFSRFAVMYGFDKLLKIKNVSADARKDKNEQKILGDIWEAYIAGVILNDPEEGFASCEKLMQLLWEPIFLRMKLDPLDIAAKQNLHKAVSAKGCTIKYKEDAPAKHNPRQGLSVFRYGVYFTGLGWSEEKLGAGEGNSTYEAQLRAAMSALRPGGETYKIAAEKARQAAQRAAAEDSAMEIQS